MKREVRTLRMDHPGGEASLSKNLHLPGLEGLCRGGNEEFSRNQLNRAPDNDVESKVGYWH